MPKSRMLIRDDEETNSLFIKLKSVLAKLANAITCFLIGSTTGPKIKRIFERIVKKVSSLWKKFKSQSTNTEKETETSSSQTRDDIKDVHEDLNFVKSEIMQSGANPNVSFGFFRLIDLAEDILKRIYAQAQWQRHVISQMKTKALTEEGNTNPVVRKIARLAFDLKGAVSHIARRFIVRTASGYPSRSKASKSTSSHKKYEEFLLLAKTLSDIIKASNSDTNPNGIRMFARDAYIRIRNLFSLGYLERDKLIKSKELLRLASL